MNSLEEKYMAYLIPPYMRSSILHAISQMDGQMVRRYTVKSLRARYPGLPRPLPLEKLAEIGLHQLQGGLISDFEK
jgi:hypothetical protein